MTHQLEIFANFQLIIGQKFCHFFSTESGIFSKNYHMQQTNSNHDALVNYSKILLFQIMSEQFLCILSVVFTCLTYTTFFLNFTHQASDFCFFNKFFLNKFSCFGFPIPMTLDLGSNSKFTDTQ